MTEQHTETEVDGLWRGAELGGDERATVLIGQGKGGKDGTDALGVDCAGGGTRGEREEEGKTPWVVHWTFGGQGGRGRWRVQGAWEDGIMEGGRGC